MEEWTGLIMDTYKKLKKDSMMKQSYGSVSAFEEKKGEEELENERK